MSTLVFSPGENTEVYSPIEPLQKQKESSKRKRGILCLVQLLLKIAIMVYKTTVNVKSSGIGKAVFLCSQQKGQSFCFALFQYNWTAL